MPSTLVESFELLVDADQLSPRLDAAATALAQLPDLEQEQSWLAAARERLAAARVTSYGDLLDRVLRLEELAGVKGERGKLLQAAIGEQLDRLQASITLAGGARSPLMDAVFQNLKIPPLRNKCAPAEVERFCAELERRLSTSYAKRILGGERWKDVAATADAFRGAVATWRGVYIEPPLPSDSPEAAALRDELAAAGQAIELHVRQARLLAQAALLPAAELLDAAGVVTAKAKRGKSESHPLLENDPPDPLLPTADERAELAAS